MRRIFITASKVFPKRYVQETAENIRYAGLDTEAQVWLGQSVLLALAVAAFTMLLSLYGDPLLFAVLSAITFAVYLVGAYMIPFFIAERRAQAVEDTLPNALQIMSSNIRAGMTPFHSMKLAARDEFGILKTELDRATTKALGTESFSDALKDMSNNIRLPALERSVKLFVRSIESGGHLAKILEETSRDINDNLMLRKELLASTKTYTVLILLTIMIGAPVLLNVSIHFTERLNSMRESFTSSTAEDLGVGLMLNESFSPEFLVDISTVIIAVTSTIACLLIGVIVSGKEKYGIRYAFIIVPLSLTIFYIIRRIVTIYLA